MSYHGTHGHCRRFLFTLVTKSALKQAGEEWEWTWSEDIMVLALEQYRLG
jgi:hypothetical protein